MGSRQGGKGEGGERKGVAGKYRDRWSKEGIVGGEMGRGEI